MLSPSAVVLHPPMSSELTPSRQQPPPPALLIHARHALDHSSHRHHRRSTDRCHRRTVLTGRPVPSRPATSACPSTFEPPKLAARGGVQECGQQRAGPSNG